MVKQKVPCPLQGLRLIKPFRLKHINKKNYNSIGNDKVSHSRANKEDN